MKTLKNLEIDSCLCVGLDPILELIPEININNIHNKIYSFLTKVIELTASDINFFKIQKAFFDELDSGKELLRSIINFININYPKKIVIVDCKIGDVNHTLQSYTKNLFINLNADGIVVNPYMGEDVFSLFNDFPNKLFFVLIRTSNLGASIIQDVQLQNGQKLWFYILSEIINKWNFNKNIIPIISLENNIDDYQKIASIIPQDMKIFWAGYGAQSKKVNNLYLLQNKDKNRFIINSSRGILYKKISNSKNWENQISKNLTQTLKDFKKNRL